MRHLFFRFMGGFRGVVLLFILGTGLGLHFYTQNVVNQLRSEAHSLVLFYAQMYARVVETESDEDISFIFEQIIRRTNFPLIITDAEKVPHGWKGLDVDPNDTSPEALEKVQHIVDQLDKEIEPVPVKYQDQTLSYLYYSDSRLVQQLQWLPYVEVGILGVFILLAFLSYANMMRSEKHNIWVGMAKETAHQLGTPLSSLMGWMEVMHARASTGTDEIYDEMSKDIQRLQLVTRRFSEIGSKPDLKDTDLAPVLAEVSDYIRRRAPRLGRPVAIIEHYAPVHAVPLNADLFQWAVENIMKNALDAMDKPNGEINVILRRTSDGRHICIELHDNGKGISAKDRKRIFKPGYSTKKRGWGLGLNLSKRIVEEYHGGKLFVKDSRPGEGTVMRIELKPY